MRTVVIVKTGGTFSSLSSQWGDFEDWFISGMAIPEDSVGIVHACCHERLPSYAQTAGVVVTGSHAMVTDREDWSERLAAWIPGLIANDIPFLGICYGHQLLAHAMGGVVGYHPEGREVGTVNVRSRTPARNDPLLEGLPQEFPAHVIHSQSVLSLPVGATLLASNSFEPHHAFRIGDSAWGLQFHPEFNAPIMRSYIDELNTDLVAEGKDVDRLQRSVGDTPESNGLLKKFAELAMPRLCR